MSVKNPKYLVIDASVMRAAGNEDAVFPESKNCRDFLIEILKTGHRVIFTDDILEEWVRHGLTRKYLTPRSKAWYILMERKGKILRHRGDTKNLDLREAILAILPKEVHPAVTKDMRLLEAAQLADERIASKDNKVHGHFQRAAINIEILQPIIWVNPADETETCIEWLKANAPADDHRTLGYIPPDKSD